MTMAAKVIHVLERFSGVSDTEVAARANTVQINMIGNSHFPNPPVDLATLKTATDTLTALIAQAADGSKKVIAERNKQRATVIDMLRMLGRYVEVQSQLDMSIFQTSGFQAASTTKASSQPLSEKIRKIEHGSNTGQISFWVRSVRFVSKIRPVAVVSAVQNPAYEVGSILGAYNLTSSVIRRTVQLSNV
jgi:hypothetical protein